MDRVFYGASPLKPARIPKSQSFWKNRAGSGINAAFRALRQMAMIAANQLKLFRGCGF